MNVNIDFCLVLRSGVSHQPCYVRTHNVDFCFWRAGVSHQPCYVRTHICNRYVVLS